VLLSPRLTMRFREPALLNPEVVQTAQQLGANFCVAVSSETIRALTKQDIGLLITKIEINVTGASILPLASAVRDVGTPAFIAWKER
jgi:hypothetical protein